MAEIRPVRSQERLGRRSRNTFRTLNQRSMKIALKDSNKATIAAYLSDLPVAPVRSFGAWLFPRVGSTLPIVDQLGSLCRWHH